jgi:hypothetical protein
MPTAALILILVRMEEVNELIADGRTWVVGRKRRWADGRYLGILWSNRRVHARSG